MGLARRARTGRGGSSLRGRFYAAFRSISTSGTAGQRDWLTLLSAAIRSRACGVAPGQVVCVPGAAAPPGWPAWFGHTTAGRTGTSALIGKGAPGGVVTVTVTGSHVNAGTGA